jgi:hypothetical protein
VGDFFFFCGKSLVFSSKNLSWCDGLFGLLAVKIYHGVVGFLFYSKYINPQTACQHISRILRGRVGGALAWQMGGRGFKPRVGHLFCTFGNMAKLGYIDRKTLCYQPCVV